MPPRPKDPSQLSVSDTLGLSLGQANDSTALAIVERRHDDNMAPVNAVRHLARVVPGTPYATIIDAVRTALADPVMANCILVVDHTAIGQAVFDMVRHAGLKTSVRRVVITGSRVAGDGTVPKQDLIGVLQMTLQEGRLHIAATLDQAATLADELRHFQWKTVRLTNDAVLAWRERPHDDLVLATAMAVWHADQPARVWLRVL